jgi:oligosaccharide repeat unit polymerase
MTVGYTIELVPSVRAFETGATYVGAIVNAIPMLSWSRPYGFATDWLAWTVKPEWAASGFGFGYSFIAEAYLNFGWIGIPIVCVIIGFLAVSLVRWAGSDAARLVVVAVFIPSFLFFVRGESVDLFRPLLWRGLLPYFVLVMIIKLSRRNSVNKSGEGPANFIRESDD